MLSAACILSFLWNASVSGMSLDEKLLVGVWRTSDKSGLSCTLSFEPDGVFHGNISNSQAILWVFNGKWTLSGATLRYLYTGSSDPRIQIGRTDSDTIIQISETELVLLTSRGERRTYFRVSG
jgi:hypothetical protein